MQLIVSMAILLVRIVMACLSGFSCMDLGTGSTSWEPVLYFLGTCPVCVCVFVILEYGSIPRCM